MLRQPAEALRLTREAQEQTGPAGDGSAMQSAQDLELEVMMRMRDSSLVERCEALLHQRRSAGDGSGQAVVLDLLARWSRVKGDSRAADTLAQQAVALAGDSITRAYALATAAVPAIDLGRSAEALSMLRRAALMADTLAEPRLGARILASMAFCQFKSGQLDSAEACAMRGIAAFESLGDTLNSLQARSTLAAIATTRGDATLALEQQNHVIRKATEYGIPHLLAANAFNKGNVMKVLKRYSEALDSYEAAWHAADRAGMLDLALISRGARAILWMDMDSASLRRTNCEQLLQDSALIVLDRAINDMRAIGNPVWETNFVLTKGEVFNWFLQPDSAMHYYRRALALAEQSGNAQAMAFALQGIGMGSYAAGRYHEAIAQWERANALNEQMGQLEHVALTADRLHFAYERIGELKKALAALRHSKEIGLQLYTDSVRQSASDQEARFDYHQQQFKDSLRAEQRIMAERDQRTIAELSASNNRKAAWGIGAFAMLAIGGGAFVWRNQRKRKDAESARALAQANERIAEERRKAAEFQNAALRAQMDEHFISNTLNAVNAHLYTDDPDTASDLLSRFAQWIRSMLENSQHPSVPLRDDLEALRTYLELQRLRLNNSFDFTVDLDPAIDAENVSVPPLVVQPLLENAIEHGVAPMKEGGRIILGARMHQGSLLLSVEDNGVGRDAAPDPGSKRHKKSSLSTRIIRDQLELLRQRTGRAAELRTIDLPQGTRVEVLLPV